LAETNQPTSPRSNQPATAPTHNVVNTWKPVTDLYIEENATGPAIPAVVEPPKRTSVPVSTPAPGAKAVPLSLNIITGFYFLQAVIYFVCAGPLLTNPDSNFSKWIVLNANAIIPFTMTHRHPEMFAKLVGQAMLFMAAISLVVGMMWVFRSWKIRWVTMAYAGGRVLRTGVYLFAGVASGVGSNLTPDSQAILIFSCCIDALICGYLAFYPGVREAFEKKY
jgi:hypothetical protein